MILDKEPIIAMSKEYPAIYKVLEYDPELGAIIKGTLETVLRRESTISIGERELLAAFVGQICKCDFVLYLHLYMATQLIEGMKPNLYLTQIKFDCPKRVKALIEVLEDSLRGYEFSMKTSVANAKALGITEREIYEVVAIGASLQMICALVRGLFIDSDKWNEKLYQELGDYILENSYIS